MLLLSYILVPNILICKIIYEMMIALEIVMIHLGLETMCTWISVLGISIISVLSVNLPFSVGQSDQLFQLVTCLCLCICLKMALFHLKS